jgi:hypothetical protein
MVCAKLEAEQIYRLLYCLSAARRQEVGRVGLAVHDRHAGDVNQDKYRVL